MDDEKTDLAQWVEGRLRSLRPADGWHPDSQRALERVRERDRIYRIRRRRWTWVVAAASVACLSVLAIPGRCDSPGSASCGQPLAIRLWAEVFWNHKTPDSGTGALPQPMVANQPISTPAPPQSVAEVQRPARPVPPWHHPAEAIEAANYKETGSPEAPITCEVYTDYECPACAALYRQTIPMLLQEYVRTGKVRLLHRDFPLPQHPYARLAARYANAAGRLGFYDVAVDQLFRTQDVWRQDGNVDRQLAEVLPPQAMRKLRELVQNDPTLDTTITEDLEAGRTDSIRQTPTIIVVWRGRRQAIAGVPNFTFLKSYLDHLVAEE